MAVLWWGPLMVAFQLLFLSTGLAEEAVSVRAPILVVDWDRLFSDPRVEQRVLGGITEERAGLVAENARIERQLTAEELELAERRPQLETAEFQELADAFDRKVQRIRAARDARERDLQRRVGVEWRKFRQKVETSLIIEIMREREAVLVMDRNLAIIYSTTIDITEEAINRMDALLDASPAQGDDRPPVAGPSPVGGQVQ